MNRGLFYFTHRRKMHPFYLKSFVDTILTRLRIIKCPPYKAAPPPHDASGPGMKCLDAAQCLPLCACTVRLHLHYGVYFRMGVG